MNISEAYKILELETNATEEQLKKQFKKLAVKYHPDVNKDPEAENKSKEISEAYNLLSKHLEQNKNPFNFNPFANQGFDPFGEPGFNPFKYNSVGYDYSDFISAKTNYFTDTNINYNLNLTFVESVLGKQVEISVDRKIKCDICLGSGQKITSEECQDCQGKGIKPSTVKTGKTTATFISPCLTCYGSGKKHVQCTCLKGRVENKSTYKVDIPGGVINDTTIRLRGVGHYKGTGSYGDILLQVHVESDPDMKLEYISSEDGFLQTSKVVSSVNISLLEAIEGCSKTVRTVLGEKSIEIKPQSKNKDVIVLSGYGVEKSGDHIITIQVNYPESILEDLIKFLKEKCQ